MRKRILWMLSAALLAAVAASAAPQPSLVVKAKGRFGDDARKFAAKYKSGEGVVSFEYPVLGAIGGPVSCQANAGRLVVLGGTLDVPVPGFPYFVAILEDHANLGGPDEFALGLAATPWDCDFTINDHGMGNVADTREPIVRGKIAIKPEN